MTRWIAVILATIGLMDTGQAYAQEVSPGPGVVEVTIIPGGGTFFMKGANTQEASFGNYDLGAGVTVNFNRYVGVEGEASGALGVRQDLRLSGLSGGTTNVKSPNLLNYSGNLVVSASNHSSIVPYATGGVGGLTLFNQSTLGIAQNKTFLTGNVGGGVKWFSRTGRWGLRGHYRFLAV